MYIFLNELLRQKQDVTTTETHTQTHGDKRAMALIDTLHLVIEEEHGGKDLSGTAAIT